MPSFQADLAFGKAAETRIASVVVEAIFPSASAVRWPETALVDFLIVRNGVALAALEVKRRRVPSSAYSETILPEAIVQTGVALNERLKIPLYAAILFSDNVLCVFRVEPQERVITVLSRTGKPIPHHCFSLTEKGVTRLALGDFW